MINGFILFSALLFALAFIMTGALNRVGYDFTLCDRFVLGFIGVAGLSVAMGVTLFLAYMIRGL